MGLKSRNVKEFSNQRFMINVILQDCPQIGIQVFFMLNHSDEFIKYISLMIWIFLISLVSIFVTMIAIYESQPLFEKINKIKQTKLKQQYRKGLRSNNAFTTATAGVSLPDMSRIASVTGIASRSNTNTNNYSNNNNNNYNNNYGNEISSPNDSRQIAMRQLMPSIVETPHDDEDYDGDGFTGVTPLELANSDIQSLDGYGGAQANGIRVGATNSNINYKIGDIGDDLDEEKEREKERQYDGDEGGTIHRNRNRDRDRDRDRDRNKDRDDENDYPTSQFERQQAVLALSTNSSFLANSSNFESTVQDIRELHSLSATFYFNVESPEVLSKQYYLLQKCNIIRQCVATIFDIDVNCVEMVRQKITMGIRFGFTIFSEYHSTNEIFNHLLHIVHSKQLHKAIQQSWHLTNDVNIVAVKTFVYEVEE